MRFKYKPSKTKAREFAMTMSEIDDFCYRNGITKSRTSDSYYFIIKGRSYRVSNHSVESSPYHDGRDKDVTYIHAGKTRIIDIYNDLVAGYVLDGRGNRK